MIYLFGFVTLLLAGAVVVLFAMLGELSSRVGVVTSPDEQVEPLPEAVIGREPSSWPARLSAMSTTDDGIALVLSTSCNSCKQIAQQMQASPELTRGNLAVIVSTPTEARGEQFVADYGLAAVLNYVDVGGDWVGNEFGVRTSPVGLVFRRGRLVSALLFGDLAALRAVVREAADART